MLISPVNPVFEPFKSFRAVLVKLPVAGYDAKKAPMIFEVPNANNSWFGDISYWCLLAMAFTTDMVSINATNARVIAIGKSFCKFVKEI